MKILLLTIDAWRASHASFVADSAEPFTPELERLAGDGTAFTQAITHGPATPYAFPGITTSRYPLDDGGYERLAPTRTPMAEPLSAAGYRTTGVHANPWLGEKYGYGRGYDQYNDVGEFGLPGFDAARELLIDRFGLDHPVYRAAQYLYRYAQVPLKYVAGGGDDEIDRARAALDGAPDDAFVWVHLLDPHAPYTPPKRHREAFSVPDFDGSMTQLVTRTQHDPESLSEHERTVIRRLYAASVRHADERAGDLLDVVDDDTLVVVTADHGEALFEHGQVGHEPALYDELLRVPLLVRPPRDYPVADRVLDAPVGHVDLAPTILDYAGASVPENYRGRSLRPAIEGGEVERVPQYSEVASTAQKPGQIDEEALQLSVRLPERKLYERDGAIVGYDLEADPEELSPIEAPDGEEWEALYGALTTRKEELDFTTTVSTERDATVQRRLKELGYLE